MHRYEQCRLGLVYKGDTDMGRDAGCGEIGLDEAIVEGQSLLVSL